MSGPVYSTDAFKTALMVAPHTQENGAEKCNTVNGGLICLLKSSDPLDEHTEGHRQNWRERNCKCKNVQSRGCRVILGKVFPCSYRRRWGLFANFRRGFSEVHLCSGVGGFVWRWSVEENGSDNMLNAPPEPTRNGLSLMCCIHHQGVIFAFTHPARSRACVCIRDYRSGSQFGECALLAFFLCWVCSVERRFAIGLFWLTSICEN